MIEPFTAKSGARSVRIDGIALHSPYDPAREALRFAEANTGPELPSAIVILGEGLGYVSAALSSVFPGVRPIRVFYSDELMRAAGGPSPDSWSPGMRIGITAFLRQNLGELDLEGLRMIEWPPSARIFPAMSRIANESVRQVAQELNGSFVTTLAAGRLWIRNSVSNFLAIDSALTGELCPSDRPIMIVAPGPTLEEAAPLIAEVHSRVDVWALPSSALFLHANGLGPDLIVMTDPGYYSMHHLRFPGLSCSLAMPLSAARGAWSIPRIGKEPAAGPFLLAQPDIFEEALLAAAGLSAPLVAPHGTVAATALELALSSTRAPVILAGLDMCTRDILQHARPNPFDQLLRIQATRVTPHYGLSYRRAEGQRVEKLPGAGGARVSPSLQTYAGWFNEPESQGAGRVCRLLPSPVPLQGMLALDGDSLRGLLRGHAPGQRGPRLRAHVPFPGRTERGQIVSRLLRGWIAELESAHASLGAAGKLDLLGHSPSLLSLAYYIEPQRLLEAKRKSRRGDSAGALGSTKDLLTGCVDFLRRIGEKTGVAA